MFFNIQPSSYQYQNSTKIRQRIRHHHISRSLEFSPILQKWITISILSVFLVTLGINLLMQWRVTSANKRIDALQSVRLERVTNNIALLAKRANLSSREHISQVAQKKFQLLPPTSEQLR